MNKKALVGITLFIIVIGAFFFLFQKQGDNEPKVAATILPLYDIVRNVAGNTIEVMPILPPGASPHTYEPLPSDITRLNDSTIVFAIGHDLDSWVGNIVEAADIKQTIIVDNGITLKTADSDHAGEYDPHYWLDVENARFIAKTVAEALITEYPKHTVEIEANLAAYDEQLVSLHFEIQEKLAAQPIAPLVTFHNSWQYFAKAYGLEVATVFEEFPGKEPTAEYLAEFQNTIKTNQIKVIFAEPQFSTQALDAITQDLGVTISTLDAEGATGLYDSYIGMMQYNTNQIIAANTVQ